MIRFARDAYDAVVAHAREGAPEEVCGVLGGTDGEDPLVSSAHRADNAASAPRSTYAIAPAEQLSLMERIERDGEAVVGFYHSHPRGPPRPSRTDAAQATWEDTPYVIVSLDGDAPFVGAWRWTGDQFRGERVALTGQAPRRRR